MERKKERREEQRLKEKEGNKDFKSEVFLVRD
jgi:hypothetical protein